MTPVCPKCNRVIPSSDVNVAADVAFCRSCNQAHKLSELVRGTAIDSDIDVTRPPKGAWYRPSGAGAVIGATHRAIGSAIGALVFGLFWNGILSVFIAVALSSTLHLMHVPLPRWAPEPIMEGGRMGVGVTMGLWLFLTPFIAVGLLMIFLFLSALAGRTEVTIRPGESVLFSGVGSIGRRKRFNADLVKDVRIQDSSWRDSDGYPQHKADVIIECEDGKEIKFGSSLKPERRNFLASALKKVLVQKRGM